MTSAKGEYMSLTAANVGRIIGRGNHGILLKDVKLEDAEVLKVIFVEGELPHRRILLNLLNHFW